jgi:GDP-mannose transporter
MADDKKTDNYTIEMDKLDKGNKEFEAAPSPLPRVTPPSPVAGHPALPVLAYCGASILMTVMNKYVLSGLDFNLNFLLLMVQVCLLSKKNRHYCPILIYPVPCLHYCYPNLQVHGSHHLS